MLTCVAPPETSRLDSFSERRSRLPSEAPPESDSFQGKWSFSVRRRVARWLQPKKQTAGRLQALAYPSMLVWVLAANPARGFYESLGGAFVRSRELELGGETHEEVGYGWLDVRALL